MPALQSVTGGIGGYYSFRMMPYRTLRFPGSENASALPASMDQRFGYSQSPGTILQISTNNAILGLRPFIDRGNPVLVYAQNQVNAGVGPFKQGLNVYI